MGCGRLSAPVACRDERVDAIAAGHPGSGRTMLAKKRTISASCRNGASTAAAHINARLAEVGSQAGCENKPLAVVIKVGEGFAKKLEEQIRLIEDIRRRLHLLAIEKRQAKLAACETQLSAWSQRWTPLVSALLLPESSTPDQVGGALAILEKVFDHLKDADRLQYRLKRIGDNIEQFEKRASQLVAAIDPSLGSVSAGVAVTQLHLRLVEAGKAETSARRT